MEQISHVKSVIWYDSLADISAYRCRCCRMMSMIFLTTQIPAAPCLQYCMILQCHPMIQWRRSNSSCNVVQGRCFISGMSAIVTDTKNLSNQETPIYVLIAVIPCCRCSFPDDGLCDRANVFLLSIGMAIVYNLGSNVFMGEISYVTQALAAVLQLGVTMDYSIFLWHSYEGTAGAL